MAAILSKMNNISMELSDTETSVLDGLELIGYQQVNEHTLSMTDDMLVNTNVTNTCLDNPSFIDNRYVFLQKAQTIDVIVMTSLLTLFGVIGCIGNAVVIAVCRRYPTKQSAQHFILAMAVCDFFVCVAIIPYRIISYHCFLFEGACKFFEGLTYFSVLFSLYLIIAVAVDRYHAVCRATAYHKLSKATGTLILAVAGITFGISIYPGMIAGHYVIVPDTGNGNETTQCFTGICNEDGQDRRFSTRSVVEFYSAGFGIMYISMVIIVIVSYTRVFRTLYVRYGSAKRKRQQMSSSGLTTNHVNRPDNSVVVASVFEMSVDNGLGVSQVDTQLCTDNADCLSTTKRRKRSRHGKKISHRRTAKILLLVTVAFILTWIPFLLMKTHVIPNIVTIRLTFFISNMINPIIYSFTNRQFRDNVSKLMSARRRENN